MKVKARTLVVFILTLSFAGIAAAQPGPGMPGKMARADRWDHRGPEFCVQRMFELGMSDKQIGKVMKIVDSHFEDAIPKQREQYELHKELRGLRQDPQANEARIKEIAARFEEMRTERETQMKKMKDEVWDVLTPDQQKQLGEDALFFRFGGGFPGSGIHGPGFCGPQMDGSGRMGAPDRPGKGMRGR